MLTAFYTPDGVSGAILSALNEYGIGRGGSGDRVLEPGCGTGAFMRATPEGMDVSYVGVEVDDLSARIARALMPEATIIHGGLEDCDVPEGSVEAVVGNVPYSADITIKGRDGRSLPIHDYFLLESLRAVRPGGVVAVLTSTGTMDKQSAGTRLAMARQAEMLAMARLPEGTFQDTGAMSDVLVLRRRPEPLGPDEAAGIPWVGTTDVRGATVNALVAARPELCLGDASVRQGRWGAEWHVGMRQGVDLGQALGESLGRQLDGALGRGYDLHDGMAPRMSEDMVSLRPRGGEAFELVAGEDGTLWYGDGEVVERVEGLEGDRLGRAIGIVRLRDSVRELLATEGRPDAGDETVADAITRVRAQYDEFVEAHGRLCERANRRAMPRGGCHDASLDAFVWPLEDVDAQGRFQGLAPVLSRRVIDPAPPMPTHVASAREALEVSMDRRGRVDVGLVASLLGTDDEGAMEALGDDVVTDPETGEALLAEEYLSGDVGSKLRRVRELIDAVEGVPERAARAEARAEVSDGHDVSEPHPSDEATDAIEAAIRASGAWDTICDPMSAAACVDPVAMVRAALGDRSMDRSSSWWRAGVDVGVDYAHLLEDLAQEMEPWGCAEGAIARGRDAVVSRLLELAKEYSTSWMVREHGPVTDDHEPCRLLWHIVTSGAFDRDAVGRMLSGEPEVGVAVTIALGGELDEYEGHRRYGGTFWSLSKHEDEVRGLMSEPEVLEYLHVLGMEKGGLGDASREGYLGYRARRDAALAQARLRHPVDMGRLTMLREVEARLVAAQPTRLTRGQIACSLGSAWVPAATLVDFLEDELQMGLCGTQTRGQSGKLSVTHSPSTGTWQVTGTLAGASEEAAARYGTDRASCLALMQGALNGTMVRVTMPDPNDPGGRRRVTDPAATQLAWSRRRALQDRFERWAWEDEGRARLLEGAYNARFNNLAPRSFDGSYLTLPGKASDVGMRPHQLDAVARVLQSREGTLVAHVVGAGKTFTGVAACMEARRLGRASKPMVVVPNHLTRQWASDFVRLYPQARVLVMDDTDTSSPEAARAFWGRAAMGDWDAVIVAQSRFTQVSLSDGAMRAHWSGRIAEMTESIREAKEHGDRLTQKRMEQVREQAKRKVRELEERSFDIDGVTFDQLGCDMLVVDEAHGFKNLAVAGAQVSGMSVAASAKCEDLLAKCEWLRAAGKGANIVFMTGTPVSNTMAELYNMQRYLAPGLLRRQGVESFTAWANTFGRLTESTEVSPDGTGFVVKQRFSRFLNLPELMAAFHTYADLRTKDMVDLDVPEVEQVVEAVPATEVQREEVRRLGERADRVHQGKVPPEVDNMLKVTGDGRKVALDPKLAHLDDPGWGPMEGGKVQRCAENVMRVWERTGRAKGTQLVFCDASTPASGRWNVYEDLADRLVALGMPREQIAFVTDAGSSPSRRDALFERVRRGEVRVLVGSTQKLGTGTNVQDRLVAIHDLDCPWRPADLEQRLGRVCRQGNMWDRVQDFRYVSEGTFDAYLYQTVERKARFIAQVFSSKTPARSMDDLDETVLSYAEIKAAATGDPKVAHRMEVENEVSQLLLLRQAHAEEAERAGTRLEQVARPARDRLAQECELAERDRESFEAAWGLAKAGGDVVVVDGRRLAGHEADEAIARAALATGVGEVARVATYEGLDVAVRSRRDGLGRSAAVTWDLGLSVPGREGTHWCPPKGGRAHVATRLRRLVSLDHEGAGERAERLAALESTCRALEMTASSEFEDEGRLHELRSELAGLTAEDGLGLAQDGDEEGHGATVGAGASVPSVASIMSAAREAAGAVTPVLPAGGGARVCR